jgi:DNA-binding LytR/AlgR family response regulator
MKVEIAEGYSEIEIVIKCPSATDEIKKMVSILQGFDNKLSGSKNGKIYFIDAKYIFYFESVDKRCFIYTEKDVYETVLKLYEIEEQLADKGFIRSSKSQILNIAKIKSLCPDFGGRLEIILENDEILMASRQYSKLLRERLGIRK